MSILQRTSKNIIGLTTCKNIREAKLIASNLVKAKLCACVNIIKGITSIYAWKGKICNDSELLLIMKGIGKNKEAIAKKIKSLHSYEVPEIIFVQLDSGSKDYLKWISKNSI